MEELTEKERKYFEDVEAVSDFLDTYGIIPGESSEKTRYDKLVEIKLTMPEFWENVEVSDVNALKQEIKQQTKKIMFATWSVTDPDYTEEDLEFVWEYCKVFIKVRKGETWTKESEQKAKEKSKQRFESAFENLENPYEEI